MSMSIDAQINGMRAGHKMTSSHWINVCPATHHLRSGERINVQPGSHRTRKMRHVRGFKLLDLFCCEGLGAWGYWQSGRFSEIVGVDSADMSTGYAFDFIQGDALALDYDFLMQFDFIHASPPCQGYSKATPKAHRANHPRLIAATHLMLAAAGKPFVIENVEGSGQELRPNVVMNGHFVGLPFERRRYFHVSGLVSTAQLIMSGRRSVHIHGPFIPRSQLVDVLGLEVIPENRRKHLTVYGMEQGIPPAMTKHIAEMVLPNKFLIG